MAEDGKFADGWLDRLPGELEPAKQTLAKYRDITSLAKAHHELQQLLGKKSAAINIPGEKASPEEVNAFRKALGVPETVDGYKLKPEQLPEGVQWDDNLTKAYAEIAHRNHIPAKAMQELAAFQVEAERVRAEQAQQAIAAELEDNRQLLRKEWGGNYETNIGLATRAAKTLGLDPGSPGLTDPNVVKALANMTKLISEDKMVAGDFSPTASPGKARARDIMTNKTNPLYEKYQQGDPDTVSMVRSMLANG